MEHYCEWQGKFIQVGENGVISIKKLTRSRKDGNRYQLELCYNKHLPFEFSKSLTCMCVSDSSSGWRLPYLLVTHNRPQPALGHKSITYELLVCESSDSFEACGLKFQVPEDRLPPDDHFHLLDGPAVLWKEGACVHIVQGTKLEQVSLNLQTISPHLKMDGIEKMWCFNSKGHPPSILLFIRVSLKEAKSLGEFGRREWLCLRVQLQDDLNMDLVEAVQIPNLIPFNYGYIATCIVTQSCIRIDKRSGAVLEKVIFLVGTEYQQVVLIESGVVKNVVSLQYVPCQLIAMKNCVGNIVLGAVSLNGDINVYEIEAAGPKDKGTWSGVMACLSGDFAQLGHNQILMLKDGGGFHLTDLSKFLATDEDGEKMEEEEEQEEEKEPSQDCPDSLLNVMKALQLKKHIGEAQLTQFEMELHHKHELLSNSLKYMGSLGKGIGSTPLKPDPSLVCLIPGKTDEIIVTSSKLGDSMEDSSSSLRVLEIWQRVIDGNWAIGILVKNTSEKVLTNVMAAVAVPGEPLTTESSCGVLWSDKLPLGPQCPQILSVSTHPPPEKRRRLVAAVVGEDRRCGHRGSQPLQPDRTVCLVVATSQQTPGQEAAIVGIWREEGGEVGKTVELARMKITSKLISSGELCVDKCCLNSWNGSLTLSSGDDEFAAKKLQDLACLLAVWSLTQVHISTQHLHISRLPSMIKARLPLPDHALQVRGSHCSSWQPPLTGSSRDDNKMAWKMMEGVALHVQLQQKDAIISILHSSESQLNLVLKLLKESLPDDVCFSPMTEAESSVLLTSLNSLREELNDRATKLEGALQDV